ncbi:MAG: T9SS type A sorting domain-containing protein [Carboxylicivirga sp.]|jgi:Leucine-rich repeat (LRR) protein|nr:T9SS type A sorting domain-containing protein [Carboxylicivirga sp.]
MKNTFLFLLLCIFQSQYIYGQYTSIPDTNFEQALIELGFDSDGTINGKISDSDLIKITYLNVSNKNINDLSGIENFTKLDSLICDNNNLTILNIPQNSTIQYLSCAKNKLTELSIEGLDYLSWVDVHENLLSNLLIGKHIGFTYDYISCWGNSLENLYIPNEILYLDCHDNSIAYFELGEQMFLQELNCSKNNITSLDLSNCRDLKKLICSYNDFRNLNLSSVNAIEYIDCYQCGISNLSLYNAGTLWQLKYLNCGYNMISNLDLSNAKRLETLYCHINHLDAIDLSQNRNLVTLSVWGNNLTSIDVSSNSNLTALSCRDNEIAELDVSQNLQLTTLYCSNNNLASLDLINNNNLQTLVCDNNQLTAIDLSKNEKLSHLTCSSNKLQNLSIKNGNNYNITNFNSLDNTDLYCIEVDDSDWANGNLPNKDEHATFSAECGNELDIKCKITIIDNYENEYTKTLVIPNILYYENIYIQDNPYALSITTTEEKANNTNSNTINIVGKIFLDASEATSEFLFDQEFMLSEENYLNLNVKVEVLNKDSNLTDNVTTSSFEIWKADFQYGKDNYQFPNWDSNPMETVEMLEELLKDNYWNHIYLLCRGLIIEELLAMNGHCYGMAANSFLYKQNPLWLPNNALNTYSLNKEGETIADIKLSFRRQAEDVFKRIYYSEVRSNERNSEIQLTRLKNYLIENKCAIASFDRHSTLVHTLIRASSLYSLYEYNNNEGSDDLNQYKYPSLRGFFTINEDKPIWSGNNNFRISVPDFGLNYLKSISKTTLYDQSEELPFDEVVDSLNILTCKEFYDSTAKAIVFIQDTIQDDKSIINYSNSQFEKIYDLGRIKILYPNPGLKLKDLDLQSQRAGTFCMNIISSQTEGIYKCEKFNNIYIGNNATLTINEEECSLSVYYTDTQNNTIINGNEISQNSSSITPIVTLTKPIPCIEFNYINEEIRIDLSDYLSDQNIFIDKSNLLDIPAFIEVKHIENQIFSFKLLDDFDNTYSISLNISNELSTNIHMSFIGESTNVLDFSKKKIFDAFVSKGFLNINLHSSEYINTTMVIYNMIGRPMMDFRINEITTKINVKNLSSGVYIVGNTNSDILPIKVVID